jgi:hypothetical protein
MNLFGCATKMAFHDEKQKITKETKPILLMKLTLSNEFRQSFQPKLMYVNIEKPSDKNIRPEQITFSSDKLGTKQTNTLMAILI